MKANNDQSSMQPLAEALAGDKCFTGSDGKPLKRQVGRKRRVHFSSGTTLAGSAAPVENDLDPSEVWYSQKDLTKVNRRNKLIVKEIKRHGFQVADRDERYCLRGLEELLSIRAHQQRRANIVTVIQSVLDEQQRQRQQGVNDPSKIQVSSETKSIGSKAAAEKRGRNDAMQSLGATSTASGVIHPRWETDAIGKKPKQTCEVEESPSDLTLRILQDALQL